MCQAFEPLQHWPHHLHSDITGKIDDPTMFVVRIGWRSAAAHHTGFRSCPEFPEFLPLIRPFIGESEKMAHYRPALVG